jgi:hypothetical protein
MEELSMLIEEGTLPIDDKFKVDVDRKMNYETMNLFFVLSKENLSFFQVMIL